MPKFCPECGTPTPYQSAKFCPNCGARLDAAADAEKKPPAPSPEGPATKKSPAPSPEGPATKKSPAPAKKGAGKKKKSPAPAKKDAGKKKSPAPASDPEGPDVEEKDPSVTEPVGTQIIFGPPESDELDKDTLTGKPKEELIDIILDQRVIERKGTEEIDFDVTKIPFPAAFDQDIDTAIRKFTRLPIGPGKRHDVEGFATWRVTLASAHPDQKLLALEIHDDVIVGRSGSGIKPDLDLTRYGGGILGVSRRHALLRPSADALQLIDLGSTNGTFCNGSSISAGIGCPLEVLHVISFAGVHFLVQSVIKI